MIGYTVILYWNIVGNLNILLNVSFYEYNGIKSGLILLCSVVHV